MPAGDANGILSTATLMLVNLINSRPLIKQPRKVDQRKVSASFRWVYPPGSEASNLSDPVLGGSSPSTLPFQPCPAPYGGRPGSVGVVVGVWESQENDKPVDFSYNCRARIFLLQRGKKINTSEDLWHFDPSPLTLSGPAACSTRVTQ